MVESGLVVLGYFLAVFSAVFNGSFTVFAKVDAVKNVDPILFNFYVCVGVFVSSLLVIPFLGSLDVSWFVFSWFSFAAGALFVFAGLFSFLAVPLVGIAIGQGMASWSPPARLCSWSNCLHYFVICIVGSHTVVA